MDDAVTSHYDLFVKNLPIGQWRHRLSPTLTINLYLAEGAAVA